MGGLVVTKPLSWQLVMANHVKHALKILQCVLLCMCLRSSCVVSAAAPADKLDLLRVEDGWQDVELS